MGKSGTFAKIVPVGLSRVLILTWSCSPGFRPNLGYVSNVLPFTSAAIANVAKTHRRSVPKRPSPNSLYSKPALTMMTNRINCQMTANSGVDMLPSGFPREAPARSGGSSELRRQISYRARPYSSFGLALRWGFAPVLSFGGFHNNGLSLLLC
jgi:hypothetical protein